MIAVLTPGRWLPASVLLGAAGAGAIVVTAVFLITNAPHATPPSSQALTAYTSAIRPVFAGAGEITELEMKPSISDFASDRLGGGELASRANGWQLAFSADSADLGKLAVPPALVSANRQFQTAMSAYGAAALWLARAGQAPDAGTAQADVSRAVAAAQQADAVFDQASAAVQAALRSAGLPADPDLPGGG